EVNQGFAGANYGWPVTEGPTADTRFVGPFYAYNHVDATGFVGCAIAGAAFYDPLVDQFPTEYRGSYFFAYLCGGFIRRVPAGFSEAITFATGISSPVDLHVSDGGSLYYLARGSGADTGVVVRIDSPRRPSVTLTANGVHGTIAVTQQDSLT